MFNIQPGIEFYRNGTLLLYNIGEWLVILYSPHRIFFKNSGPRLSYFNTGDSRYNDSVCYQSFCCKIEFAVMMKLDMDPSKA